MTTTEHQHLAPSVIWEFVVGTRLVRPDELQHFRTCGHCLEQWCYIRKKAESLLPSLSAHKSKEARTVGRRGERNVKSGIYKSLCCDFKIVLTEGDVFPDCPRHPAWAAVWARVAADPTSRTNLATDDNTSDQDNLKSVA
jgi:hypothetical protein